MTKKSNEGVTNSFTKYHAVLEGKSDKEADATVRSVFQKIVDSGALVSVSYGFGANRPPVIILELLENQSPEDFFNPNIEFKLYGGK